MIRDLTRFHDNQFDVLVVGGGVLGACVARDAALRGLSVALVEAGDFSGWASANSLKIVHGGLRYLQHFNLGRMRRSIFERSHWLRVAPHLVEPLPVLIPTLPRGLQRGPILRLALTINDLLSWDRNRGLPAERILPGGYGLSRAECLRLVPELNNPEITGGVVFHDAQMYNSERLVLELVQAAAAEGAEVANYAEVVGALRIGDELVGVTALDSLSGERFEVRAKVIVNAAGRAVGAVAERLGSRPDSSDLSYVLAINVVVHHRGHSVAFAVRGDSEKPGSLRGLTNRQFFFVPWRERLMIGTGYYPPEGEPPGFELREEHIAKFLADVNAAWQGPPLALSEVVLAHAELIPVRRSRHSGAVSFLERHRITDGSQAGGTAVISALTGKYTTARGAAEDVMNVVGRKLGHKLPPCRTATTPLPGAEGDSPSVLEASAQRRFGALLERDILEHLVRTYGCRYEGILAYRHSLRGWNQRVLDKSPVIRAQWAHSIRAEWARLPMDLLFRRTELGARGLCSESLLSAASEFLETELGSNDRGRDDPPWEAGSLRSESGGIP